MGKPSSDKPYRAEMSVPEADIDSRYFNTVMNNLIIIDTALAGMDGYSQINVPLLVDSLIGKMLSKKEKTRVKLYKKKLVLEATKDLVTKEDINVATLEANMEIYGECIEYFSKYMTFETRLGVMIA